MTTLTSPRKRVIKKVCQAHEAGERCGSKAVWLCTAVCIEWRCDACHHDEPCCRRAEEIR